MRRPGTPPANKGQRYPPEVLTPTEVQALLATFSKRAPTGIRNRALVVLLLRSGLRVSEVLALRPADVDMEAHSIRLLDTKSGRPQTRGFHPSAEAALQRWLDLREKLGIGNHGRKLFCTLSNVPTAKSHPGGPMSDVSVRKLLKEAARGAGIVKRVTPHTLRHTFAAELEAQGLTVTVISKLMGHANMAVTSRYLDHLTNAQAVQALADLGLPQLGGEEAAEGESDDEASGANPDLVLLREVLANPAAVTALAKIARTAAGRAPRVPREDDPETLAARRRERQEQQKAREAAAEAGALADDLRDTAEMAAEGMTRYQAVKAVKRLRAKGASLREIAPAVGYSAETVRKMAAE